MEKSKITIEGIRERVELTAKRLCGRSTPDKRVAVILAAMVLLGGGSVYTIVASLYNFGKERGRALEIERIETIQPQTDSVNIQNLFDYERTNQ